LLELGREGEEVGRELGAAVQTLAKQVEETELDTLLTGEYDATDAILGGAHREPAGPNRRTGRRCCFRMYTRWAESRGLRADVLD
jgi:peptide chain release factor 2